MTDEDCNSSNQLIAEERESSKKKPKASFKKPPVVRPINRNPPAPIPDMGPYANGYAQPTVEDDISPVRSDLG
jgi:hypothetical protein